MPKWERALPDALYSHLFHCIIRKTSAKCSRLKWQHCTLISYWHQWQHKLQSGKESGLVSYFLTIEKSLEIKPWTWPLIRLKLKHDLIKFVKQTLTENWLNYSQINHCSHSIKAKQSKLMGWNCPSHIDICNIMKDITLENISAKNMFSQWFSSLEQAVDLNHCISIARLI